MKYIIYVLLALLSVSVKSEENDFKYFGSFTSERYTQEHYYLTEFWLWEKEAELIGLFFVWGGLGGSGPVKPMSIMIDNASKNGEEFTFNASSFSFVGHLRDKEISGNLTNGDENWNGGEDKIVFTQGSNIQTVKNPSSSLKDSQQWLQWVNTLE
jgi:hypothetical protein